MPARRKRKLKFPFFVAYESMTISNDQIAVIILNYYDSETTLNCVRSAQGALAPGIFLVDNSANETEGSKSKKMLLHYLFIIST